MVSLRPSGASFECTHLVPKGGRGVSLTEREGTPKREVRKSGWRYLLFVQHCSNLSVERRHFGLHDIPRCLVVTPLWSEWASER